MWYILTLEFYSALKSKELLTHAITWMDMEDIVPSEIYPNTKVQILYDSTYRGPRVIKFKETENRMVIHRA